MKKIGKQLFHPVVSAAVVAFFFTLAILGSALFALLAFLYIILRHPIRFPLVFAHMYVEWRRRVD